MQPWPIRNLWHFKNRFLRVVLENIYCAKKSTPPLSCRPACRGSATGDWESKELPPWPRVIQVWLCAVTADMAVINVDWSRTKSTRMYSFTGLRLPQRNRYRLQTKAASRSHKPHKSVRLLRVAVITVAWLSWCLLTLRYPSEHFMCGV